jgi:hypothetical protein
MRRIVPPESDILAVGAQLTVIGHLSSTDFRRSQLAAVLEWCSPSRSASS